MSYIYASTAFRTLEAAQRASVMEYVTAGGDWRDGLEYLETVTDAEVVSDLVTDGWRVPEVDMSVEAGRAEVEAIVSDLRDRLRDYEGRG